MKANINQDKKWTLSCKILIADQSKLPRAATKTSCGLRSSLSFIYTATSDKVTTYTSPNYRDHIRGKNCNRAQNWLQQIVGFIKIQIIFNIKISPACHHILPSSWDENYMNIPLTNTATRSSMSHCMCFN